MVIGRSDASALKRLRCARPAEPRFGITMLTHVNKTNYAVFHLPWKSEFRGRNDVPLVRHYSYCYVPPASQC